MIPGQASHTARAVAAYRLGFERLTCPAGGDLGDPASNDLGDPASDDLLTATVAAGITVDTTSRMSRYLEARTRFFDRLVVDAIEHGVPQIVNLGAGYDGRSLRFRHRGVQWFEVDHPDTQADKRHQLTALAIDHADIRFVAIDFASGTDLADAMHGAGFDGSVEALVLWEGVVAYLEVADILATLRSLRQAVAPGSRLGVSVATFTDEVRHGAFARAVGEMGEQAAPRITPDVAGELLRETGWSVTPGGSEARGDGSASARLGFVIASAA